MSVVFDAKDIKRLEHAIDAVGGIAKKQITPAVKGAMQPVLTKAKELAPVRTGKLRSALELKGERHRAPGKKGYQVTIPAKYNEDFVRHTSWYSGNKRYYYPASMEYGFRIRKGGKVYRVGQGQSSVKITKGGVEGRYPGKKYMKTAMAESESELPHRIADGVVKEMEKQWIKKNPTVLTQNWD